MTIRPPVPWFGGKGHMHKIIIEQFPDHICYVEPFGGAGSVILNKSPAAIEVYNDLNSGLVNLFQVLRNKEGFKSIVELAELTPYSREIFNAFKKEWMNESDPVQKAHKWLCVGRWSFSGVFGGSWSHSTNTSRRSKDAYVVTKWLSSIQNLEKIHQRMSVVQIENLPFQKVLEKYDSETTLFYCDPPYLHETRTGKSEYKHEMSEDDHEELVALLKTDRVTGEECNG
jgi:DNA adenine methylase